ncbi:hypothetical protein ES703_100722 [subsurface metagenome]
MKRVLVISLAAVLALCLSMVALPAKPIMANPGDIYVPDDYPTIQAAIDAAFAAEGGTVNVAAGTYYENIEMLDNVIIQGSGANVTFIDGGGSGSVVTANNVGSNVKLDGFTITGGNATSTVGGAGGGISLQYNSSANISNCIIIGNSADLYGGGISVHKSSPIISNCLITGNTAGTYGGGILIFFSSPSPTVTNCTLTGNSATDGGGVHNWSSSPTITNSIIYGNTATGNGPNIFDLSSTPSVVTYSCVGGGYSGTGNINDNPLFVNPGGGDYRLQSGSPCIDAGNNNAPGILEFDLDGNLRIANGRVDMGAYEATAVIDTIPVEIDIKPGSDPNSINPDSKGVIPVAILTTADFDAASVNATTVRFGKEGNEAAPVHYALEDVDGDGDFDMILHFKTQKTGITAGDTEATLRGKTTDGIEIIDTDFVRTVPPKGKKGGK